MTWIKGRHVIKTGVELRRAQMNQGGSSYGTVSFNSLANFAADESYKASITRDYPVNGLRKTDLFGYIQDEFKWRPNFTLNLWLRYNIFGIFSEVRGRAEAFNVFDRAIYANPDGLISTSDFGRIYLPLNTTPAGLGTPRQMQFMLKLEF